MVQAGEGRTYCRTCAGMMRNCRQPASVPPNFRCPSGRGGLVRAMCPGAFRTRPCRLSLPFRSPLRADMDMKKAPFSLALMRKRTPFRLHSM